MKVLFLNSVFGSGSTGKIVLSLLRGVQSAGHDGLVIYGVKNGQEPSEERALYLNSRPDYYLHNALSRLTDHAGCYSTAATKRIIRAIRDYAPDLIHLHTLHGYYLNTNLLFRFLADYGKPVIWTLHDCWAFTGHCTHFSTIDCKQWQTGCKHCAQLRRYPKCVLGGDVAANFARKRASFTSLSDLTVTVPSDWLARTVRQSFLGEYRIETIPNGIDTDCFRPQPGKLPEQLGLEGKKLALAVASVWNKQKGLEDLALLAKLLPENWRLLLVGLREEQKQGLPPAVLSLGRTASQKELAAIYSAADVFVNPSYEETMGLTTAEALACGTPAVVYDRTAVPELVDPLSGIVVPAGDVQALCHAVVNCQLSRENARRRGECFSVSRQNEAFLALYNELYSG